MPEPKKSIIRIFQENELRVSRLYKLYAEKLPAHKDFWEKISAEEIEHSKSIGDIFQKDQYKNEYFQENNFTRGIIKYVTDFIEEQMEYAKNKPITHIEAINIALRVEQSVLEKKYFEMFISTKETLKSVFEKLNREIEMHVNRLRKELRKQINKSNN